MVLSSSSPRPSFLLSDASGSAAPTPVPQRVGNTSATAATAKMTTTKSAGAASKGPNIGERLERLEGRVGTILEDVLFGVEHLAEYVESLAVRQSSLNADDLQPPPPAPVPVATAAARPAAEAAAAAPVALTPIHASAPAPAPLQASTPPHMPPQTFAPAGGCFYYHPSQPPRMVHAPAAPPPVAWPPMPYATMPAAVAPAQLPSMAAYMPPGKPSAQHAPGYFYFMPSTWQGAYHGGAPSPPAQATPEGGTAPPFVSGATPWDPTELRRSRQVPGPGAYNPKHPQRISFNARLAPDADNPGYGSFEAPPLPARKYMRDPSYAPAVRPRAKQEASRARGVERAQVAARDSSSGQALTTVAGAVGADTSAFSVSIPIA